MRLLPDLVAESGYPPLKRFLSGGSLERLRQLCQRLSDLMDQYQMYRADRLQDWEEGRDLLRGHAGGVIEAAPTDQAWQPLLWRHSEQHYGRTSCRRACCCTPAFCRGAERSVLAVFSLTTVLQHAIQTIQSLEFLLLHHAAVYVAGRIAQVKQQQRQFGFADMLSRLRLRLRLALEAGSGESADALRQRIVGQYPVALVDEFQDTSPDQYSILNTLYRVDQGSAEHSALFMIGDPKQAIYGFRGADMHSYLAARAATAGITGSTPISAPPMRCYRQSTTCSIMPSRWQAVPAIQPVHFAFAHPPATHCRSNPCRRTGPRKCW